MNRTLLGAALVGVSIAAIALMPDSSRTGCGAVCCRRPAGAPIESCLRRDPNTGEARDFGDLNTMAEFTAVDWEEIAANWVDDAEFCELEKG